MEWESILCPALMVLAVVLFALRRSLLRFITCASVIIAAGTVLAGLEAWQGILVFLGSYAALFLLALAFLAIICALVDLNKPQEHDSKFYRTVMDLYIEALISLVWVRLDARGLENIPKEGRFLVVCNHLFIADPGIVLHCFRHSQLDQEGKLPAAHHRQIPAQNSLPAHRPGERPAGPEVHHSVHPAAAE